MKDTNIKTEFTISYDATGDLQSHTIDAQDLGNAIIGMHELITKAAKIVSNGSSEADLKVIAPAKEGSLEIIYAIIADPTTTIAVMQSIGIGVSAAAASIGTAFGIMDRIKDKKIERVIIDTKTQKASIQTNDGTIETSSRVAQLVSSREVRQALHKVIQAPLRGLEGAKIKVSAGQQDTILDEAEIKNFTPIKTDVTEKETKTSQTKTVQFTKLNFKSRRGWTVLSTDGLEANVTIKDDAFIQKVAMNEEAFQKDKLYSVELEKTEVTNVSGTHVKYAILRVISEINP